MKFPILAVIAAASLGAVCGSVGTFVLLDRKPSPTNSATVDPAPLRAALAKLRAQVDVGLTVTELAASLTDIQTQASLLGGTLSADQSAAMNALMTRGKAVLSLWRASLRPECPQRCEDEMASGLVEIGILKKTVDWYITDRGARREIFSELGGRSGFASTILGSLSAPLAALQTAI